MGKKQPSGGLPARGRPGGVSVWSLTCCAGKDGSVKMIRGTATGIGAAVSVGGVVAEPRSSATAAPTRAAGGAAIGHRQAPLQLLPLSAVADPILGVTPRLIPNTF